MCTTVSSSPGVASPFCTTIRTSGSSDKIVTTSWRTASSKSPLLSARVFPSVVGNAAKSNGCKGHVGVDLAGAAGPIEHDHLGDAHLGGCDHIAIRHDERRRCHGVDNSAAAAHRCQQQDNGKDDRRASDGACTIPVCCDQLRSPLADRRSCGVWPAFPYLLLAGNPVKSTLTKIGRGCRAPTPSNGRCYRSSLVSVNVLPGGQGRYNAQLWAPIALR